MTTIGSLPAPSPRERALRVLEARRQWKRLFTVDEAELARLIECEVWAAERRLLDQIRSAAADRRRAPNGRRATSSL